MRVHRLSSSLRLARPIDEVFAFFGDAANLERITPPELGFEILTPMPVAMEKGTRLDYRLRLWGVRFRWQTLISSWEPPHRFVDEQLAGPYAQWVHTHRFEADGDGTLVEDDVDYALPLAPLGELALPIVRRQLERIFSYRRETIARLLG